MQISINSSGPSLSINSKNIQLYILAVIVNKNQLQNQKKFIFMRLMKMI